MNKEGEPEVRSKEGYVHDKHTRRQECTGGCGRLTTRTFFVQLQYLASNEILRMVT